MKNLLNKGRVIVSCVSILAILAVSMLSMFTGMVFVASADDAVVDETVSYPLNGKYDADVTILEGGITYKDVATDGTVSNFTGFDSKFWLTAKGDGTSADPYIVETANQFAAVATGYLTYEDGKTYLDTTGVSFKVADGVKAFNMNNTDSTVDFSGTMTTAEVDAALANATVRKENNVTLNWSAYKEFKGRFDGNGVVVYGLKSNSGSYGGLFVKTAGAAIRNITVKNCYFKGDSAGVLVGYNTTADPVTVQNCSIYNNVGVSTRLNAGVNYGGVIIGRCYSSANKVTISNCLVYGNSVRHAKTAVASNDNNRVVGDYDINYSLVANFNTIGSLNVNDSIIMDNVPYNVDYGHNSFNYSTFNNVYTNMLDMEFTVVDFNKTVKDADTKTEHFIKTICNADGTVLHTYNKFDGGEDKKVNYTRTHEAGTLIKADVSSTFSTLDKNVWSFNENGYPTPRIYQVREYSAGKAWTGEVALFYSGGSGTQDAPYQIATAEEFALMMTTMKAGEHFVLTADIVLNDTTAANWTDTAKRWFTSNDVCEFTGTFNGNGHTVSGIYYDGKQAGEYAGLIPVVGSGAVVKNVKVANSYLNGKEGAIGGTVGTVVDMCSTTTKFSAIVIEDTVEFDGRAVAGGIIGKIGYSAAKIDDCISKSAGLYGEVIGQANVKRSISVGAYPFPSVDNVKAVAVYTDTATLELDGVTVVDNANMKGSAAETAMPGLVFPTSWKVVDGNYPVPTGAEASSDGVVGEPWSGAVASGYAGGEGTKDKPYLIETPEQLAYFLVNMQPGTRGNLKYYKLTADIYLNDVDGNLWKDKVGCNEWYTQRSSYNGKGIKAASTANAAWISLDGDGHVVYGLYVNQTNTNEKYYRAGLIPYLHIGSEIKNLGLSQAYLNGSLTNESESIGGLVGTISQDVSRKNGIYDLTSDDINNLYSHDYEKAREVQNNPLYLEIEPDIINCFVDHTCVIRGYLAGGLVGSTGSGIRIQDCIVTATVEGTKEYGAIVGQDWSVISTMADTVSLPQNCVRPAMGGTYSDWRDRQAVWAAQVYQVYYFGIERMRNDYFIKLSNPKDRIGEAAKAIMTGLDWEETIGDGGTWRLVENGTPVLTVFAKHRTAEELEKFSDKNFSPPEVTITFSTGTSDVQVEPISGRMYAKMQLPTNIKREGYKFTGWYAFSDLSVEYPYDHFPPRSLTVFAGWEPIGVMQGFETYPETVWDFDDNYWAINKPGVKGGYKNAYTHNGSKSLHLLGTSSETVDALLNYEDMLVPGKAYKLTFWVLADKDNTPATLLSLVHNSKPDYLNSAVAVEDMAVATGLKSGEWVQYSYSFTAQTKWVSLRATGNASLYFDDFLMAELDGALGAGNLIVLGSNGAAGGVLSPATGDGTVSVAVLISAIMACAAVAVVSRKNLIEVVED